MANNPHTVLLHGRDDDRKHGVADGTITPGDAVAFTGTTDRGDMKLSRQTTDDAPDVLVALEYAKTGKGIDDDYASGNSMEYWSPGAGEQFYMRLVSGADASTGTDANVSVGDVLAPSGTDGTLEVAGTAAAGSFVALEAVDNSSASAGNHVRLKVEAI